ncbi:MAG: hypothetical protein ACRD1K_10455 [Acidimicrobiales bacterium]
MLDNQDTHRGARHRPRLNEVVNLEDLVSDQGGQVVGGAWLDRASISPSLVIQRCTG